MILHHSGVLALPTAPPPITRLTIRPWIKSELYIVSQDHNNNNNNNNTEAKLTCVSIGVISDAIAEANTNPSGADSDINKIPALNW